MVKCVICGLVLVYKNRGIGAVSVKSIADHYIEKHSIKPDRDAFVNYIGSLMVENHDEFIPLQCSCEPVFYLTAKEYAIHQLREGCDLEDLINPQVGGARVSFFEDAPTRRGVRTRQKIISDEEVDDYYTFSAEETNVESVKLYNLKYTRKIDTLTVNDLVLPPLAFLNHAVENMRKFTLKNDLLKDGGDWVHAKMQLVVGNNNTQNNSFIITANEEDVSQDEMKPIGPELTFVSSPMNVTHMSFNNLINQQKNNIENKLLESQQNGSGWTIHSISYIDFLLVINPKNISAVGLRKLVGGGGAYGPGMDYQFDMGQWALNEAEVDGDESEDEEETDVNEYDKSDKFINDNVNEEESESSDVSFYLKQNSKRRQDFDDQQEAGPSSKKSRLETIIENYEEIENVVSEVDSDGQVERNNAVKLGRSRKISDDLDDIESEEGAELKDFNRGPNKIKEYTHYLKDYSVYDAFAAITEDGKSEDFRVTNLYRRKRLTHCILKSILGGIYEKQCKKDGESYVDFVEGVRNGSNKDSVINFQYTVLLSFSKTTIKGCYFNEVMSYVKAIEHAMNKTLYLNVFLEQKTVQSCSIYSDKKSFKSYNDNRAKEYKVRRPMKLIYPTIVPLPETKTIENSFNILIRKPTKADPLLLHCVTITNLNRMFKAVSLSNKEKTSSVLYVCAGCTTSYVNSGSYFKHIKKCTTNINNRVILLEKTYLKYDYRCARRRSFKAPFHIVFDVETKSCSHESTMEAEMKEGKKNATSSKERMRRLVLNSYAITVYADDLPDIESFTIYRSLTAEDSIKFDMKKLPASLEEFVDEEDLYYRKMLEEQEINMYNFANILVADLNLISQSMITFCNIHAMTTNKALDDSRFDRNALIRKTIADRLPCCICKQFFASYTEKEIMNGGVDKEEFKDMIRKEYQVSYRETVLMGIKESGKVKDDEFLNELADKRSKKIEANLTEFIYVTYLVNLLLSRIRTKLYSACSVTYKHDHRVQVNVRKTIKELSNKVKIFWSDEQIVKARDIIITHFEKLAKAFICVDQDKLEYVEELLEEENDRDDTWLCDLIQFVEVSKCPAIKFKKITDFDVVSEDGSNANFLLMYKNVTQLMGCADALVVHHDHFTGHIYGLAHNFCNLQMRQYSMTACDIFSHNASFDLKYVMDGMLKNLTCLRGKDYSDKVTFIGNSTEKIRMMFVAQMRFKDSIQIFMDSLDNLARSMTAIQKEKVVEQLSEYLIQNGKLNKMKFLMFDGEDAMSKLEMIGLFNGKDAAVIRGGWKIILKDTVQKTLYDEKGLIKKSPFPYEACTTDEYMTMKRDKLPPIEDYYSLLKQSGVDKKDYDYANEIFTRYGMESVEEFNEFYNVMDAIITSVFLGESSNRLYKETGIEIRNCSSMSQFSGIAMLLKSKETPQLPNSLSMYEMVTRGIRAGLSAIGKRYAVNSSALGKDTFERLCRIPDTYPPSYYAFTILKVDENNQYGGAQDDQMPFIGFIERDDPTVEMTLNLISKMDSAEETGTGYGFVATVAMYLPNHLHDKNILYSPMIIKMAPELQWMSPLQLRHYGEPLKAKGEYRKITPNLKLMSTVGSVDDYCCTDNLLKHLLDNGWILTKVTKLVEFKSKDYVKAYVIENQNLRMRTTCMVEKKVRKDMNNTLYGNYCMKVEKHMKQTMIYDEIGSVNNVTKMCDVLNKDNPHAPSHEDVINTINKDIEELKASFEKGDINEEEQISIMDGHEESLKCMQEMIEADADTDAFDEHFQNDSYSNQKFKNYKPRSEKEYAHVDAKLMIELSNMNTKQIKRIANDFSNNYVSCLVQSEKKDNLLSTLRCNAVKVLDNAKISISKYNIAFQKIMEEDDCDVQLIGTDTDSGIYSIRKEVGSYEENLAFPDRIDELVHRYMSDQMDYSNYPTDHPFYDKTFKKNFHRFQNEHPPPSIVTEAIAPGPKEYLLTIIKKDDFTSNEEVWGKVKEMDANNVKFNESTKEGVLKRHKGLSHRYIVTRNDYLSRVHKFEEFETAKHKNSGGIGKVETYSLRSERGKMFLMKMDKVKMSKLMDKTYIFSDGVTTCPFGHYRLKPIIDLNESVSYSELFSKEHLIKLLKLECELVKEWPLIRKRMEVYEKCERHFRAL